MNTVTSPTAHMPRRRRGVRAAVVACLVLALVGTSSVGISRAEDLKDKQEKARKALTQGRKEVTSAREGVTDASDELDDSRKDLEQVSLELAATEQKLDEARERDAELAAELAAAEDALTEATKAVAAGQLEVSAQEARIAGIVRRAYQQQSGLEKLGFVLQGTDTADVANRIQFTEMAFSSSASAMDRLKELQLKLDQARTQQADATEAVAEKKKASEEQVAAVKKLKEQAEAQQATVAALVAADKEALAAAKDELEASEAEYRKLQNAEAKIAAKIRAQIAKETGVDPGSDKASGASTSASSWGFIYPVNAKAGSPFGLRFHPILKYWRMHWGTDFGASCGAPLYAMADGKVTSAGWQATGLGYYTIISYGKIRGYNLSSGYAHQSKIIVKSGQKVKQGQLVGYVGTTGLSTGCHLHLQMYRNGTRVNPMKYL